MWLSWQACQCSSRDRYQHANLNALVAAALFLCLVASGTHADCWMQIVQFIGAHIDVEQIVLVTEFMPRGDLWHALSSDLERNFCWAKRWLAVYLTLLRLSSPQLP